MLRAAANTVPAIGDLEIKQGFVDNPIGAEINQAEVSVGIALTIGHIPFFKRCAIEGTKIMIKERVSSVLTGFEGLALS